MAIPFIDFKEQHRLIAKEIETGFQRVFERGDFILGQDEKKFEEEFAAYCGVRYSVGVNSGTDALYLAMAALDIGPGDDVIVPSFTFIATALCVSYTGANVVFADVEERTGNLDPKSVEKVLTKNTKAMIPVHLYGQPADMTQLNAIAKKHNIKIVEDACQAHGAFYQKKRVGALGDMGCFSFYPTKSLGAYGDGGMIVTDSEEVYNKIMMLRDYGRKGRYEHRIKGYNSRLDTLQAIVLSAKLKHLDVWNKMRADNAAHYAQLLKGVEGVQTPTVQPDRTHVYQTYALRLKNRDQMMEALQKKGISALIHYPIPLHLQEAYQELKHKKGDFPVSERLAQEVLSIPMFPHMTKDQVEFVCAAVKENVAVAMR